MKASLTTSIDVSGTSFENLPHLVSYTTFPAPYFHIKAVNTTLSIVNRETKPGCVVRAHETRGKFANKLKKHYLYFTWRINYYNEFSYSENSRKWNSKLPISDNHCPTWKFYDLWFFRNVQFLSWNCINNIRSQMTIPSLRNVQWIFNFITGTKYAIIVKANNSRHLGLFGRSSMRSFLNWITF